MRILEINDLEVQLIGSQAFLYNKKSGASDVLNISDIENCENAEQIIETELELLNRSSLTVSASLI